MAADSSFNVQRWLKAVGFSSYTAAFTGHGYVNYERCINFFEEDVRAVVNNEWDVVRLMKRVKELRKFTEEDAVKLLSVSICNKCTLCIGSCFFGPLLYTGMLDSPSRGRQGLGCSVRLSEIESNKELKEEATEGSD